MSITLAAAVVLSVVHIASVYIKVLDVIPRSRWLSAASGVSVAYVFVHLLPELARGQAELIQTLPVAVAFLEHHAYLVALIGLVSLYGLERRVRAHRRVKAGAERSNPRLFRVHMASFTVYNALIGYLLVQRQESGEGSTTLYMFAMALHMFVNDYGLRHDHPHDYVAYGRWLLAAAVLAGWTLGTTYELSQQAVIGLTAFLSGGILLNVLKEELPAERESRFGAFLVGTAASAALLLLL